MKLVDKEFVEGCECRSVLNSEITTIEKEIIPKMIEVMKDGIGLAAPQVGINQKFFIMKYQGEVISVYNPSIVFTSKQKKAMKEGCLTYPSATYGFVNIMRPVTIQVSFTNCKGENVLYRLRGLDAKVFQHEFDHLNGITIFYRKVK